MTQAHWQRAELLILTNTVRQGDEGNSLNIGLRRRDRQRDHAISSRWRGDLHLRNISWNAVADVFETVV